MDECGATETSALDIDPFLLVMAEAVIRGASPALTETSVNAPEVDPVSHRWTLAAPLGALAEDQFRFFLADGTEPEAHDTYLEPVLITKDNLADAERAIEAGVAEASATPEATPMA